MQTALAELSMSSQTRPGLILLFICLLAKEVKLRVILGGFVVCLLGIFLAFGNICSADKMLFHGYL